MPRTKISEYSATANSNTDVAGVNVDEGCAPSGINNAIRAVMGHLKDFQVGTNGDPFNGPVNGTVGATTPATVAATTLTTSSTVTHNGGTANGVAYLNGSKVLTTGSALSYNGTGLGIGSASAITALTFPAGATVSWGNSLGSMDYMQVGSGAMGFGINGSEQMRLTSTGLGIGTSSVPNYAGYKTLAINGTSGGEIDFLDGGMVRGQIYSASTSLTVSTFGAIPLLLGTNGIERARIDSSGNVGIGTSSPTNVLSVTRSNIGYWNNSSGWTGTPTAIVITNSTLGGYDPVLIGRMTDSGGTSVDSFAIGTVGTGVWTAGNVASQTADLYIAVKNTTGAISERMRIDSSGNLLIGYATSNGAYKLQVNSQIFATSSTIATSDANYKENVVPLTNALDLVKGLNPVQFSWKQHPVHNFDTTTPTVGFIAQEVQATLGQMPFVDSVVKQSEVTLPDETKEQFLGIAEGNMIAILTAALKELNAKFDAYVASHP